MTKKKIKFHNIGFCLMWEAFVKKILNMLFNRQKQAFRENYILYALKKQLVITGEALLGHECKITQLRAFLKSV